MPYCLRSMTRLLPYYMRSWWRVSSETPSCWDACKFGQLDMLSGTLALEGRLGEKVGSFSETEPVGLGD